MTISVDKKYKTRDGREVRIYAVDGGGDYPVQGAYRKGDRWIPETWTTKGTALLSGDPYRDLVEVKPEEITRWIIVGSEWGYSSKEAAVADFSDCYSDEPQMSVVKVTFTPGEGLED